VLSEEWLAAGCRTQENEEKAKPQIFIFFFGWDFLFSACRIALVIGRVFRKA
jgi:hypothetical protein